MGATLYSSPEESNKFRVNFMHSCGHSKLIQKDITIPLDDMEFKKTWLEVHFHLGDDDRKNAIAWAVLKEDYEHAALLKDMGDFMKDDKRYGEVFMGMKVSKNKK